MCFGRDRTDVVHCSGALTALRLHTHFLSRNFVGCDKFRVLARRLVVINPFNLKTSTRENGGDQNLIARALEGSKILQSVDEKVRQLVGQLQPVQVISDTLVGFRRAGESMAGAHMIVRVSRPAKQLQHRRAPFDNRILVLEWKSKLLFKPFSAESPNDQRVKELVERLVLWVVPDFVPDDPKPGITLDHAGLNLRYSPRHHPRGRSSQHLIPQSVDAFIAAAVAIRFPVETTWTRPRRVEAWCGHRETPRQDPVHTKQKREVATKPFSHRRPLKNVFNDGLGSRVPAASGLHVSDFPNRVAWAIVLTCGRKLSVAANDEVAILDKLLLRVHQLRAGK